MNFVSPWVVKVTKKKEHSVNFKWSVIYASMLTLRVTTRATANKVSLISFPNVLCDFHWEKEFRRFEACSGYGRPWWVGSVIGHRQCVCVCVCVYVCMFDDELMITCYRSAFVCACVWVCEKKRKRTVYIRSRLIQRRHTQNMDSKDIIRRRRRRRRRRRERRG